MVDWDSLAPFIKVNKGRIIGFSIGLIFGVLVLTIGFWRSLFLSLCCIAGCWFGGIHDKKEKFLNFLDRILPTGLK